MTDPSKISPIIDSQFPDFVAENHPKFLEFMRAYYAWMETQNQVLEQSSNILRNQDIDYSQSKYLEQLFKEFLVNIPRNVVVDKAILLKNIRQFYRARGTEKSYKMFFRFLYGLNVEFYYPRVDILKVSDGKWINQQSIRVFLLSGAATSLTSNRIKGLSSSTTAFVERASLIQFGSFIGYELTLNSSSITGDFIPGEIVKLDLPNTNVTARISAVPTKVSVSKNLLGNSISGLGYSVGEKFEINQLGNGIKIQISSVDSEGKILTIRILEYGLGYEATFPITQYSLQSSTAIQPAKIDITLGALISYPGFYKNEDGQLSTTKYIHDGNFYQQFSYVLYVNDSLNVYESAIKKLLHPAGFKLFGGFRSQNLFSATPKAIQNKLIRRINHKKLSIDSLNVSVAGITTDVKLTHQSMRAQNSYPLGPSRNSVFRDRYLYKPVSKYNANSEFSTISNYFGIFGNLSAQFAITPVSIFDEAGLTPFNIETDPYSATKLLPDAVIKTETV